MHLNRNPLRKHRYSPELVYGVVSDVDRYQEFVPYTTYSKVLSRRGPVSRAELCGMLLDGVLLSHTFAFLHF